MKGSRKIGRVGSSLESVPKQPVFVIFAKKMQSAPHVLPFHNLHREQSVGSKLIKNIKKKNLKKPFMIGPMLPAHGMREHIHQWNGLVHRHKLA
ncbi:MAG: hypothetical protein MI807_06505, partial [Verrucomicrobiales bacterium]|nr:hypothetical protein [Verrucomicrobiales bacterium]